MIKDPDALDIQVRVLEQALCSPEYRFNSLARAVFEARLVVLRLAMLGHRDGRHVYVTSAGDAVAVFGQS